MSLHNYCKECSREHTRKYREKNKKKCDAALKKWREENKDKVRESSRQWYRANIDKCNAYAREYRKKNPEIYRKNAKRWVENNPERYKKNQELWIKNNRDKTNQYSARYCENYPERRKATKQKSSAKINTTAHGNLNNRMRANIQSALKGNKNGRGWESLVGYTCADLKKHIEGQFKDGMDWSNRDKWHIDHIVPISAFNFTKPEHEDFKRCWALENLRPLWAGDNMSKGAKLDKHFQPRLRLPL